MAIPTYIQIPGLPSSEQVYIYEWRLTSTDPVGDPMMFPAMADRTVQFVGSTWGGATAVVEGSLWTDANFASLTNQSGVVVSATADDLSVITEATTSIRPRLSTVGSGADVTVRILVRK
jgi:hypothetical protein